MTVKLPNDFRAYYFTLTPTGNKQIDAILEAVASAGDGYHHTEDWNNLNDDGVSPVMEIQRAADKATEGLQSEVPCGTEALLKQAWELSTWAGSINWRGGENQKEWLDDLRVLIEAFQTNYKAYEGGVSQTESSLVPESEIVETLRHRKGMAHYVLKQLAAAGYRIVK